MTPQLEFKVNGESISKFKVDGGASGEKLRLMVTPQLKFKVNGESILELLELAVARH